MRGVVIFIKLKSDFPFKVFRHTLWLHKCVVRQASTLRTTRRSWGSREQPGARVHRKPRTTATDRCRFSHDGVRTKGLTFNHVMQVSHDMKFAQWFKVDRYYLIRLINAYEIETLPENVKRNKIYNLFGQMFMDVSISTYGWTNISPHRCILLFSQI